MRNPTRRVRASGRHSGNSGHRCLTPRCPFRWPSALFAVQPTRLRLRGGTHGTSPAALVPTLDQHADLKADLCVSGPVERGTMDKTWAKPGRPGGARLPDGHSVSEARHWTMARMKLASR
jgi:hypothetical protein